MKTDKILAVGKEATLEINFKKAISYPPEIWVGICRKHYPNEDITAVYDGHKHHICKYCGGIANGVDEDVLCKECRDDFGHAFFSEL